MSFDEKEELYENTTYTINMGESIVDYTVGNPMSNFTYVFSTGAYLDSLSVSGKVTDDFTGEPQENLLVSLYADLQDSAVYKQRPLYFTRTDEQGRFRIKNIRKDSFNIFALDDKNLNFYKDQESEKIGFYDDAFFLDSIKNNIQIGVFAPEPALRIISKTQTKGEVKLTVNKELDSLQIIADTSTAILPPFYTQDTVYIWHKNSSEQEITLDPDGLADSITLAAYADSTLAKKANRYALTNVSKASPMSPYDSLTIKCNAPILSLNEELIAVYDTAQQKMEMSIHRTDKDPRIFKIKARWIEGENHELEILPEAIETNLGIRKDTIKQTFGVNLKKTLGEIAFQLDSLNKDVWYVVEFSQGANKIIRLVKNTSSYSVTLSGLKPGKYTVRVTEDLNKNGRWDPGDFFTRRKSERWISKDLESLKPNWTLDVKINGDDFK